VVNGSPAVREAVLGVADEVGARGVVVDDPVTFALSDGDRTYEAVYRGERVDTRLAAPYECENIQTAVTAAEAGPYDVPAAAVRETLATYKGAGRCEFVGASPEVLLDGAHNPDGAAALAAVLDRAEDVTLVFGGSEDGWRPTLDRLLPVVDRVVATCGPNYDEPTAAEVGAAVDAAAVVPDPVDAVDRAAALGGPDTLVAVTGSLYVLDPVRAALTE
jgi:dihydrofolate synthase/folylpolyglutamate synthase